jgi:hypothetical protein
MPRVDPDDLGRPVDGDAEHLPASLHLRETMATLSRRGG